MDQPKLLLVLDSSATLETEEINKPDNCHGARERLAQLGRDTCSSTSEDERRVRLYQEYEGLPKRNCSKQECSGNRCERQVRGLNIQKDKDDSEDQGCKRIRNHKCKLTGRKKHSKYGYSRKYCYKGISKQSIQVKDDYSSRKNSKYTCLATSSKEQVDHESIEGDGVDDGYNFQVEGGGRELAEVMNQSADHTAQELQNCKKLLNPYLTFLQLVGWRCWRESHQHLTMPRCVFFLNVMYPFLFIALLIFACISQVFTCFIRHGNPQFTVEANASRIHNVECTKHLVTEFVIPYILLLVSYLWGIYLFRFKETESLPSLMESVYIISFNSNDRKGSQKRLSIVLRMCLSLAMVWLALSLAGNILRLLSLRHLYKDTHISFLTFHHVSEHNHTTVEEVLRSVLVMYSLFGFFLFDLLYVAVVLTYIANAQLLLTYISCVIDKVRIKACSLDKAVTNIMDICKFLQVLNKEVATPTSLCLYIFIASAISSVVGLTQVSEKEGKTFYWLVVSVGCVNFLQWLILSLAPIAQAAHLTAYCRRLCRLGLEIAARPHMYTNTHQLLLMSFLEYTSFTRFTAKLAGVPISPAVLFGFLFFFGLLANLMIEIYNPFVFAHWI